MWHLSGTKAGTLWMGAEGWLMGGWDRRGEGVSARVLWPWQLPIAPKTPQGRLLTSPQVQFYLGWLS